MQKSPSMMCTLSAISIILLSPLILNLQFFSTPPPDQFLLRYYGHGKRYDTEEAGHIIRFRSHSHGYDLETESYLRMAQI